ncbi:MAG: hypothetical protein IJN65_02925 [Clostridia bacterium]|nr:hypothetical protein [Clostridia bacterium]
MAKPEKFIRSKCPNCKKNGIEFWKTGTRYNPKLTCKYCNKTYKVRWIVSFVFTVVWAVVMGTALRLVREYIFEIPVWLCFVIALITYSIFEYFAPLKEIDNINDINEIE